MQAPAGTQARHTLIWAGLALGFGLGGFFDGILLHQILQWHHLLSGIIQAGRDIRFLILTDGLFHGLMYIVTAMGIWLLWKSRDLCREPGTGGHLLAAVMAGFGTWHIIDGVLSHWILGIHRVRMDVENPLIWDVVWLAAFGMLPLFLAWLMHRAETTRDRFQNSPVAIIITILLAGSAASISPSTNTTVIVYFRPDLTAPEMLSALDAVDGNILWTDPSTQVWAINLPPKANPLALYVKGAIFVSSTLSPAGCFNWMKAHI